jgi:radical SAM family uncharacterized protein/radical SAM-linked protein
MSIEPTPHPYSAFVHKVDKPARYLGGEFGAKVKPWDSVRSRVCLAFPDLYDIGMSHLGFKILYKILNDHPDILAERAYAPWKDMEAELRERKLPLLSLENAKSLHEFDVVGFSLQFELTYTNVLLMLDLGGVPLRSSDRTEADPLVIAGGPTATHPEPLASFIDAIVIGDGEERTTELALAWADLKERGLPRAERLRHLAKMPGVYVPSLYKLTECPDTGRQVVAGPVYDDLPFPIERCLLADLNKFPFPDDSPVGGPEAIFDRMSIEIARGCTEGCRFCQAGMIYRPVRERDPEAIVDTVVSAIKKSGYDEASLTSLSTADYSCIAPLIKKVTEKLAPELVSLGVSSLRAYGLEEPVLDDIQRVRASGITFAPEAGSQRMRDVVNKNVTEEQLMTTAERIFSRNWASMKLYFMIGLPTEEEEDVREIVRVGGRAREVGRIKKKEKGQGPPTVTVSVSTHVPKPHTPFQWCAMDTTEDVRKKQGWLQEEAKRARVELRMHESDTSWLEGVFSRGDRRLGDVLEHAYRGGARFDSWEDRLRLDAWDAAFDAMKVEPANYLGTIPVTARLPWDHIDVGLEEGFLLDEYRKALKSRLSPPCGKVKGMFIHHTNLADASADDRKLVCYDCGVACDLGTMREERLVYLRKLGAEERRPVVPKAPVVEQERRPDGSLKRKGPPPRPVQGEPRKYRFSFEKAGKSAFLSHLDLIRALPRAFRRLEIPMYYTGGYHPKPDMIFSPALSLGVSSLDEYMDIRLTCDGDPAEWIAGLSESSMEGLRFTGGVRLGPKDAPIGRIIELAQYVVAIPTSALAAYGHQQGLAAQVQTFLGKESSKVMRNMKGIGKSVDVRPFVRSMHVDAPDAHALIARAGIIGSFTALSFETNVLHSGSAKVSEVLEAVFGKRDESLPYRAVRTALGALRDGKLVSPLSLEALQQVAPEVPSAATSVVEAAPGGP